MSQQELLVRLPIETPSATVGTRFSHHPVETAGQKIASALSSSEARNDAQIGKPLQSRLKRRRNRLPAVDSIQHEEVVRIEAHGYLSANSLEKAHELRVLNFTV